MNKNANPIDAGWRFDNSYALLPEELFIPQNPEPVAKPALVVLNRALAESMGLDADALEAEPYDPARVKAAVANFTARSEALFVTGGEAAMAVFDQLSPEERRLMAQHLRNREDRGRGKPEDP